MVRAHGLSRRGEYVEHENGGKGVEYRKQLAAMFASAARREFDLLLVWSLDRFSREGMAATVVHLQRLASGQQLGPYAVKRRVVGH